MDQWNSIAERKIREAMEEGAFDNLNGKGRPLDLQEDPYEDPSMRMAHRLLRNNGFAPPWVEERRDIVRDIDLARQELERSSACDRERALDVYRERIADINRRITSHNLKTASATLHLLPLKS
jgi:DnaJ family protein C protein 28